MNTKTTTMLLPLILATSTLNCGGSDAVSEPYEVSSGGSYVGDSGGPAPAQPDLQYVGSWAGTWRIAGSAVDQGSLSMSISASGGMTGSMTFAGSDEQKRFGIGTLTGQVYGHAVTFSYTFNNLARTSGIGSFGGVANGKAKITFAVDQASDSTGFFDLTMNNQFKARILAGAGPEQE